ncbi:hypothetical protein [Nonomuraea typhae]|uniref:hypothetical protein n=1 Tax=Nonomuraea typhae TaxID=2603600 RepID=UPI0012FBC6AB|nr:hypothetical protein [Nonomuraea typhae]
MRLVLVMMMLAALWTGGDDEKREAAVGRVALIGVPGLHWEDVDARRTPNLWQLARRSGLGSLSVKAVGTTACPFDGWLTVSSGVRSAYPGRCGLAPEPVTSGDGATIDLAAVHALRDGKRAGTLGGAVRDAGMCTTAVGRGAALALADRTGRVDVYADTPARLGDWSRCPVLAVDVDALIRPYLGPDGTMARVPEAITPERRRAAVREADAQVGAALAKLPAGTQVLLAGIGDHGSVPHLRVLMWTGSPGTVLGSNSTRRDNIAILPDLTPQVLTAAGVPVPPAAVGNPFVVGRTALTGDAVNELRGSDAAATTVRNTSGVFFSAYAVLQVSFYVLAYFLLARRRRLRFVRTGALGLAAVPVSTYLVNLLPWQHAGVPLLALIPGVVAIAALILLVAAGGPWRRHPLGPPAVLAVITGATLLADMLSGTPLQFNSLMGYTAVVGGRYYGLANIPFALFATSVLLATAIAADHLVRSGRQRLAVALIAGLGLMAMLLTGTPGIGSDFGGVIAFVPGIAVTALLVAGRRVSVLKVLLFCGLGGVIVSAIAVLDSLRPPQSQTHLGRFVGQVLDGTFMPLIGRKIGAMLHTLLSPNLMPVVIVGLALLVFALLRPDLVSAGAVPEAFARAPMLRAGLIGALVSAGVGMLVNDSGTAVLSMAVALAVPLVLYVGARVST